MKDQALVVVDMLYDFIDGSLACQGADEAIARTLKFISRNIGRDGDTEVEILDTFPVLFIRDHHPADHCSFKENGGIWPAARNFLVDPQDLTRHDPLLGFRRRAVSKALFRGAR